MSESVSDSYIKSIL